jgi:hypothetical protein
METDGDRNVDMNMDRDRGPDTDRSWETQQRHNIL